jgi:hypothetical protein
MTFLEIIRPYRFAASSDSSRSGVLRESSPKPASFCYDTTVDSKALTRDHRCGLDDPAYYAGSCERRRPPV